MEEYSHVLRRLANLLDEDFYRNLPLVIKELLELITEMYRYNLFFKNRIE